MANKPGPITLGDNITRTKAEKRTSKFYMVSRLQRQAPELFQAGCRGEMSANAAGHLGAD
jgi:hypothetical protein